MDRNRAVTVAETAAALSARNAKNAKWKREKNSDKGPCRSLQYAPSRYPAPKTEPRATATAMPILPKMWDSASARTDVATAEKIEEAELSVMSRACLQQRINSIRELHRILNAWIQRRTVKSVHWQFTAQEARLRLRRLYPITSTETEHQVLQGEPSESSTIRQPFDAAPFQRPSASQSVATQGAVFQSP